MSQPMPQSNDSPHIADLMIEDVKSRKRAGLNQYGHALQANNGRNALRDLYEELLDAAQYCKQRLVEEDALQAELAAVRERNARQEEALKLTGPYPHMCRTDHIQIGYAGEYREGDERCPLCFERDRADALESDRDALRKERDELAEQVAIHNRSFMGHVYVKNEEYGQLCSDRRDRDALRARVGELESEVERWTRAAQVGHASPCTFGPLCHYCEIERLAARLTEAEGLLRPFARWFQIAGDCSQKIDSGEVWDAYRAAAAFLATPNQSANGESGQ